MIDLSIVEGSIPTHPKVVELLQSIGPDDVMCLPDRNRYQDLQKQLGHHYAASQDEVVLGNGSDEIIEAVARLCSEGGGPALVVVPTFERLLTVSEKYDIPTLTIELKEKNDFKYDDVAHEQVITAIKKNNPSVVWLCSPNNPTGQPIDKRYLRELSKCLENSVLVIDEVFMDFAANYEDYSFVQETRKATNTVVLGSFSKTWGLAALRVGFAIGNKRLAANIRKYTLYYNLSSISVESALTCLGDVRFRDQHISDMQNIKKSLESELSKLKAFTFVAGSESNHLLIKGTTVRNLHKELQVRGIKTKDLSEKFSPLLEGYIRCKVPGNNQQLAVLINALKEISEKQ